MEFDPFSNESQVHSRQASSNRASTINESVGTTAAFLNQEPAMTRVRDVVSPVNTSELLPSAAIHSSPTAKTKKHVRYNVPTSNDSSAEKLPYENGSPAYAGSPRNRSPRGSFDRGLPTRFGNNLLAPTRNQESSMVTQYDDDPPKFLEEERTLLSGYRPSESDRPASTTTPSKRLNHQPSRDRKIEEEDDDEPAMAKAASGSMNSVNSEMGTVAKFRKFMATMMEYYHESSFYTTYRSYANSIRFQVLVLATIEMALYGSLIGVVQYVLGTELKSISSYNLVHSFMALQGKCTIGVGHMLSQTVAKGFAADELVHHGIPITELVIAPNSIDPPQGRQLKMLYEMSVIAIEVSLWVMAYVMEWYNVDSDLGRFPCTVPTYNTNWTFTQNLADFLQGDTEFAVIESYGLPLVSGLVGGSPSFPSASPATEFSMQGNGLLYAINVACSEPTLFTGPPTKDFSIKLNLQNEENWGDYYNTAVVVQFPANAHNVQQWAKKDIIQKCQLQVVTGDGLVDYHYKLDEWGNFLSYSVQSIKIKDLYLSPNMNPQLDFSTVVNAMGSSTQAHTNVTKWIQQGIEIVFGNTSMKSTHRATTADLFVWGVDSVNNVYDVTQTYQGIAAAVGSIGHYITNQIDWSTTAMCSYTGADGHGIINAPDWSRFLSLGLIGFSIFLEIFLVVSWFLLVGGGPGIDLAGQMIDHPLRMLYYMRSTAGKLITQMRISDIGQISLRQHLKNVKLKFGETKESREFDVGILKLDEPKQVVKIRRDRDYR